MTRRGVRIDIESVIGLSELADYVVPFTIRVVCDLRIADLLAGGPQAVEALATETGTHAPSLARALRALACKGIFTEVREGTFALTDLAEPLRGDHPLSLRDAYPLLPGDVRAWARFEHSVRTGEAAFDHVHGVGYWEYLREHPDERARFDASQQAATRLELRAVLPVYPWGDLRSVVDVGGGNGAFLAGILRQHRGLDCIVLDLPEAVAGAGPVFAAAGVADRCTTVTGSFFDALPPGHGAYLLKRVLYHWDDEDARAILARVAEALPPEGRLLVVEPVIEPGNDFDVGKLYDLLLLALAGGRARSREELEMLLGRAGLQLTRLVRTMMLPVVEARRA